MEQTLAIIKPGATKRQTAGEIIGYIEKTSGIEIVEIKRLRFDAALAVDFYQEHLDKDFFGRLMVHTLSGPCYALILEGDGAIAKWRQRMKQLRSVFAGDGADNAVHGSDSPEAAAREIGLVFGPREVQVPLKIQRGLYGSEYGHTPTRGTKFSAGLDLYAAEDITIKAATATAVHTGVYAEIPPGYFGLLCVRSGLGTKHGINLSNAPGIIDSDYRGEVIVSLRNHGTIPYQVQKGDRVAQLVLVPYLHADVVEVSELSKTGRGDGGHGSPGK